jgi:hypothetical protein
MMAPLTAPQIPLVLAIPPQKPELILGMMSDRIFLLSVTESRTLSAQK